MIEIPTLPTTKQFRDAVKTAFQLHGLTMIKSRTRQEHLSGHYIHYDVRIHYNYRDHALSSRVRRVEIWTPKPEDKDAQASFQSAVNDINVWMKLSGVEPYLKTSQKVWEPSRITGWCLIS